MTDDFRLSPSQLREMDECVFPRPIPDRHWMELHEGYVREAQEVDENFKVLLVGDSIVERMQRSSLWSGKFERLGCLNFEIGGDRVENVLWRMENGELDFRVTPKAVVVFVGTNNVDCSPESIFGGIRKLVETVKGKLGDVPVVLPTLLPKGRIPNPYRKKNEEVNELLAKEYRENPTVHVVPIHENLVEKDGRISAKIMHDFLHLTDLGYRKTFDAVYDRLCSLLNE